MRFLANMFNHSAMGQRSLEDVIGIFGHQCRALGHEFTWEVGNRGFLDGDQGVNVIVEGFTESMLPLLTAAHERGARFMMLATEEPTERGFNHGTQVEMVARQKVFPQFARLFDGIVYLVPGEHVHRFYSQFAPSAHVELGYAPSLVRFGRNEPRFDFGFYGSLTPRRIKILKRLMKRSGGKPLKVVADFVSQKERDLAMQEAKVILQIRKFDAMGLVSSSRCNTALCLGRPVVAEPHLLSEQWADVVQFTESIEHFYSAAMLTVAAWRGVHATQFERFKEKFSPENCAGRALDAIGILRDRKAAA